MEAAAVADHLYSMANQHSAIDFGCTLLMILLKWQVVVIYIKCSQD
jgi:hypothetical protein